MKEYRIFYGYWIVAAVFIISAYVTGVIAYGFTVIFEPIANDLGWSYASVSIAASIRGLEVGLLAPIVGMLFDRLGPRRLIFSGGLITGLGLILLSNVSSLPSFYGSFILIASGTSTCIGVVPMTLAAQWFNRKRSLFTGIVACGVATGGVMIPVVTKVIDTFGWRTGMVIFGTCTWLIILPLSLILRHKPEQYGYFPDGDRDFDITAKKDLKPLNDTERGISVCEVLKTKVFWHFEVGLICHVFALHAVITHIMPYLSSIGISRSTSGYVASAIPLISIFGRLSSGWYGDRWDKRKLTSIYIFISAVSLFCFAYIDRVGIWLLIPFIILFSLGYGGPVPMISVLLSEKFGITRLGSIMGLAQGIAMFGSITGQPLAGWVFDTFGRYQEAWICYAWVVMIGAISIFTIPTER